MLETSNAEKSFFYNLVYEFYNTLGLEFEIRNIIIVFSSVFIFKILFNIYNLNLQEKYSWKIYQYASNTLLKIYISKDFNFFLNNNSSVLMRNILNEAMGLRASVFVPLVGIVSEIIILLSMLSLLLLLNFEITLKLIIFFFITLFFYKFITKNFFVRLGEKRVFFSEYQYKLIPKIFSLIKEIKILKKENQFYKYFADINKKFSDNNRIFSVTYILPRSIIEILIILVFSYFVLNSNIENISSYFPYFAVYLGAAYRILPSFVKIVNNFRSLDFSAKPLEIFTKEFKDIKYKLKDFEDKNNVSKYKKIKFEKNINLKNVTFKYDGRDQKIFENFNLVIKKNETIGIKGKSGKGKSTLVNIICGLIKPDEGEIFVDNKNILENIDSWQNNINLVQQEPILVDDTIENNITLSFFGEKIDHDALEDSMQKSDIKNFIDSLENGLKTDIGERGIQLSGGQKQRISFARALYSNPDLLILDEITSALDKDTEKKILTSLSELKSNKTLIIISHKEEPLKICDRVIEL